MEFRILGPLEVVRDGVALDLGGPKQRAVLAALLANAGRPVSADRLADDVWDGSPPPAAAPTLRAYISNLRKAVEPASQPSVLVTQGRSYVLHADSIDATCFESLADDARQAATAGDHATAARLLTSALALWRGRAYEDYDTSFARAEASRLEELRLNATEDLVECRLALGEHADLASELDALTSAHPWRERLWIARMLALYRAGRQGDALHVYEHVCRLFADELGIEPSPQLRATHESIVRQEDSSPISKQTLSFLFTDVELSTEKLLAAADEREYASMLERHRVALHDAIAAHGGRDVRTWGDAFFAVFDSATDAVRAAVASQLALPDDVRVRMGVHTGEAASVSGELVGIAIHTAARVEAAAHGGQIIITQATRELLDASACPDVGFAELGPHRLKDIPEPIRLYQLTHPQLDADFAAPRTLSALPHNLPVQSTTFVGRSHDVRAVVDDLSRSRLVTLTGVGGVGKTRLAQEVAAEVLPSYPDGVWLCELAGVGDDEGIIGTISRTIGVEPQPEMSRADTLVGALRQRNCLLLLDNCEHLLTPVAGLSERIVRSCPTVTLLATSREGIGVEGEHLRPLRSLTVPDEDAEDVSSSESVQLFCDRARAVRPEFDLGPHNASAIAAICRRLDGVPLAIELAAARVGSMGPLEIAARLDKSLRFLRSGRRTVAERHRTLQAAIEWSYELLSPDEQLVYDRLSVFAGGFDLDAVEAVCGGIDGDLADLLDALVTKSMVQADVSGEPVRYSMLETLRQFGHAKLEDRGEADVVHRAHAEHFVGRAEIADAGMLGDGTQFWMAWFEREFDNLRTVHAWAVTNELPCIALRLVCALKYYGQAGMIRLDTEGMWTERALAIPGAEGCELFPTACGLASVPALMRGDRALATHLAERGLSAVADPDDPRRLWALYALGCVAFFEGDLESAERRAEEAIRVARLNNEWQPQSEFVFMRALAASYVGEHARALEYVEELRALASNAPVSDAILDYASGEVILDRDPPRALAFLDRAAQGFEALKDRFGVGIALTSAVTLRGRHFDPYESLPGYLELIEHWRKQGNWNQQWTVLRNLLELFGRIGRDEAAVVLHFAADSSPTAAQTFGAEAERLAALLPQLAQRLGPDRYEAAFERGTRTSPEDVLDYACAEIEAALAQRLSNEAPTPVS